MVLVARLGRFDEDPVSVRADHERRAGTPVAEMIQDPACLDALDWAAALMAWWAGLFDQGRAVHGFALGGAVVAAERDVSSDVQGDAHLAVGRLGDAGGDRACPGGGVDDAALEIGSDE